MLFTCPADSARGGSKPTARGKRRHLCVDVHCHVHYLPADELRRSGADLRQHLGIY